MKLVISRLLLLLSFLTLFSCKQDDDEMYEEPSVDVSGPAISKYDFVIGTKYVKVHDRDRDRYISVGSNHGAVYLDYVSEGNAYVNKPLTLSGTVSYQTTYSNEWKEFTFIETRKTDSYGNMMFFVSKQMDNADEKITQVKVSAILRADVGGDIFEKKFDFTNTSLWQMGVGYALSLLSDYSIDYYTDVDYYLNENNVLVREVDTGFDIDGGISLERNEDYTEAEVNSIRKEMSNSLKSSRL